MEFHDKLSELVKAGWSFQLVPDVSEWGVVYASVIWSLKRSALDETIDGPAASLPLLQQVNLVEGDGLAGNIERMFERVFPVPPAGDLPGANVEPSPWDDLPEVDL